MIMDTSAGISSCQTTNSLKRNKVKIKLSVRHLRRPDKVKTGLDKTGATLNSPNHAFFPLMAI